MAKILIVEDNYMNLEIAKELLERASHEIIAAENGEEGIRLAQSENPDLILMDLSLPEMDGLSTTMLIKNYPLTENIPVVAFTALVMNADRENAIKAGCDGFIAKPIEVSTFVSTVEGYIKQNKPITSVNQEITTSEQKAEEILFQENQTQNNLHNILIVDDNPMNTELLKETLDQIGQDSIIAYSAKKALEIIITEKFDLILLDIMMPEINGFELAQELRNNPKTADIPIIFISALAEISDIVKGINIAHYGYITKPYNLEELKARVLNVLKIKDLQDKLKSETKKLDLIFKYSTDGIAILNAEKEFISCNDQLMQWLHKDIDEITGNKFCDLIDCKNRNSENCHIEELKRGIKLYNKTSLIREIYINKKGLTSVLSINHSAIINNEGKIDGYVLIIRDVTVDKEIENQKETFVATLTHDLKTPIRAEIRAIELLLKGSFGEVSSNQIELLTDMLHSNKYMFNMLDNLLSTYRYENGNVKLKRDYIDINNLIRNCHIELKYLAEEKNQQITIEISEEPIIVHADLIEIKRVIMNLLSNAMLYTQDGGNIIIKSELSNDLAYISFTDNGRGLSEAEIARLFNKYTSYTKKFRHVGTGLGLYLSKQIVNLHGGDITIISQEEKGSTFTISMPCAINTPVG